MKIWQVDAFTREPFKGNPAGVMILKENLSDELMQNIAIEKNLSETAFVFMHEGKNPLLRWFTPTREVDLCGHGTLSAAHIYLTEIYPELKEVIFDTKSAGCLTVQKNNTDYTMDFPSRQGKKVNLDAVPKFVLDALSETMPIEAYQARDLMLVYENEETIRNMKPDFKVLEKYEHWIIVTGRGKVIVTGRSEKYDFVSRFFCPNDVIIEDPVTGSAHCTLAPYWAQKLGKNHLNAYQASRRGGELILDVKNDHIYITGSAITVINGDIIL